MELDITTIKCTEVDDCINGQLVFFVHGEQNTLKWLVLDHYYRAIAKRMEAEGLVFMHLPHLLQVVGEHIYGYMKGDNSDTVDNKIPSSQLSNVLPEDVLMATNDLSALILYRPEIQSFIIARFPISDDLHVHASFIDQFASTYSLHTSSDKARSMVSQVEELQNYRDYADISYSIDSSSEKVEDLVKTGANRPPTKVRPYELPCEDGLIAGLSETTPKESIVHTAILELKRESEYYDFEYYEAPRYKPTEEQYAEIVDKESKRLMQKLHKAWIELRAKGISEELLLKILHGHQHPSRMVVKDGHIWLLDISVVYVQMSVLDRAFYTLYLYHPEGINFKDMTDYKDELLDIYFSLSMRTNYSRLRKSVTDFVDPTKNKMNESVSRIKRAFLSKLCPELAELYYIKGNRGEAKSIALDRNLVEITYEDTKDPKERLTLREKIAKALG